VKKDTVIVLLALVTIVALSPQKVQPAPIIKKHSLATYVKSIQDHMKEKEIK